MAIYACSVWYAGAYDCNVPDACILRTFQKQTKNQKDTKAYTIMYRMQARWQHCRWFQWKILWKHHHWCVHTHNIRWVLSRSGWANKVIENIHTTFQGSYHTVSSKTYSRTQFLKSLMSISGFGQHQKSCRGISLANWSGPKTELTIRTRLEK